MTQFAMQCALYKSERNPGQRYLIVDHCHVKIAELLQGIGQVGMGLSHVGIQHDAAVIECDALLIVPQLVIYGSNQQQDISSVDVLANINLQYTAA